MLMTNKTIRPDWLPAVSHKDQSARVQCVGEMHENFYALLSKMKTVCKDNHPVIINTSLNGKKQSMLNDYRDMMNLFLRTKVKFAVTENYILLK